MLLGFKPLGYPWIPDEGFATDTTAQAVQTGAEHPRHHVRRRAAYSPLLIGMPQVQEEVPLGGWTATESFQHQARRAGRSAYHLLFPIISDLEQVDTALPTYFPERAPGYRRATPDAYRLVGGSVDLIVDGAPQAGCCYTPSRPEYRMMSHQRPDASSGYRATRPEQGSSTRTRPDGGSGYRPQRPDHGDTHRNRPGDC